MIRLFKNCLPLSLRRLFVQPLRRVVGSCLVIGFSLGLLGCTHAEKASDRVFETSTLFVRRTTEVDNLGFRKINRMKPLLYKDLVIAANGIDGVAAFDRTSGQIRWRQNIVNGAEPSAALINDRLFIGGGDGQFYSLQANDGKILWTFPTRIETLAEPLLADGVLYVLTGNNTLYALDAASGKQLWLYSRQDPSSLSIRGGSKPALRNGTLYVGFSDGALVALLASNGAVKWEKQLNRNKKFRDLDSDPLIENDYLYVLGFDDQVYCLRAGTGETVWHSDRGGYGSLLLSGDRLYFATSTGEFAALNKETGEKIWSFPLKQGIATSAALYKGLVIFGESQGSLRVVDAGNGKLISSFDPGRGILSPPVVDEANSRVYFISGEANLFAMNIGWKLAPRIPYLK